MKSSLLSSEFQPTKGNILVVDDNPANLRLLIDILGQQGYQVRPVPNGKIALAAATGLPPDLILLDIMMPDMDGYQVCQMLKSEPKTADIPIIFISAINEVIDKVKAFQVGAVDYITKPFQIEEVLVRVHTHLQIRLLQKNLAREKKILTQTIEQLQLTQEQLIHREKMAALGQLIAGIAHEINTPMGAIRSSVENLTDFFTNKLTRLPQLLQALSPQETEYVKYILEIYQRRNTTYSTREKRQLRRNINDQLQEAGITGADTLADTLVDLGFEGGNSIINILPLLKNDSGKKVLNMAYELATLQSSSETILTATERASKVVFALRSYARYESGGQLVRSNIAEGIETILTLYHNQLKQGVEVIRNYEDIPPIDCYPDELNQVWTNLISNALAAMENKGILTIKSKKVASEIVVSIEDNGSGIPVDVQPKIFDPFFTTKASGEGSGLGLDIVKKIVDKHGGKIAVTSVPNNTIFTVTLPIERASEANNA
ncbi:MAG: Sensor histidine kinase RcsC [Chroococcopsis gigantea SAG 12.99]|jgi:two-component system NtrC family sensor kinase|nr:response regulator [Chlorogloea purpurea SAG 13.99]MDV2999068.1 Sensor histidine kinase RcsC [Chroococcopsis gigantea SAG 12.99]